MKRIYKWLSWRTLIIGLVSASFLCASMYFANLLPVGCWQCAVIHYGYSLANLNLWLGLSMFFGFVSMFLWIPLLLSYTWDRQDSSIGGQK